VADGPDDCVIPIDVAKDKTLEDFTQASSAGYIAYFFFTPNIVNNSATGISFCVFLCMSLSVCMPMCLLYVSECLYVSVRIYICLSV